MKFVKIFLLTILLILGLVTIAVVAGYSYYNSEITKTIEVAGEGDYFNLTIERGQGVEEISNLFVKNGYIKQPLILKAYLYLNKDKKIDAGNYKVKKEGLNLIKLVDTLHGGTFTHKLTFIEGWRVEEYGDYLRKQIDDNFADKFLKSPDVKEGYMFPDTYTIEENFKPEDLASWMRNTYKKRVTTDLLDKAEFRNLTEDQVIIVASILEREMNIKKDRPVVAGILIKRWQSDWALQADATVQYAKGNEADWWPPVTRDDLRSVKSPYNTYINKGLPPAPISNPSLDAIESVVNYQETPYWFYITDKEGVTHYAKTIEEHNANVAKYL